MQQLSLEDGNYRIAVTLTGGSGRASIQSPTQMTVEDGQARAQLIWSSPYYDYMKIEGETYFPVNEEGNSTFEIPVLALDEEMTVVADTVAMSTPHEITYSLCFDSNSIQSADSHGAFYRAAGAVTGVFIGFVILICLYYLWYRKKLKSLMLGAFSVFLIGLSACGLKAGTDVKQINPDISSELTCHSVLENEYAKEYTIVKYEDGYSMIGISDGSRFLVVPKGGKVPGDLSGDIFVIQQPVSEIYLAATAVMDMFAKMEAMDCIRFSSLEADSWHIPMAREAMEQGEIIYAGKYNAPDYELLKASDCKLSIQSTMAEHVPQIKEQLKLLGISVLVDRSSYEEHPLGRMEWIKVYGVLTGREAWADAAYEQQKQAFEKGSTTEKFDKTVALFHVTTTGAVTIRKPDDYVAKMIAMAGGTYIFSDLQSTEGATGTMNLQMEEFYAKAKDADFLIYNSTIAGEIYTLEELVAISPLFKDFKAVQNGNVWCISADFYQNSMELGTATEDINRMLRMEETDDDAFIFLFQLK